MGIKILEIVRDGPCITFPNVHDSSIVQLQIERKNFLEVSFLRRDGEKIVFRVDGLIEFGVTELVDGAGVSEIFSVPILEIGDVYVDKFAHPWKIVNGTVSTNEYLDRSEKALLETHPNAIYFWIECNSSGYIAAVGSKVTAYIPAVA